MAVQGLWVIPAPALSCCDSHTGTARVSLHCVQRRPWACSNPHKTPVKPALFSSQALRCSFLVLLNYSLWWCLKWWPLKWCPHSFLRLLCIPPASSPSINLWAVVFPGSWPQNLPYCSIPGSASHPCGSSPQSIHVCIHTQRSQCSLPKELPWLQAQPCGGQAGVSLAQPSQGSAWQWAHQLWKDALEVLPLSSAVKAPHLPAKEPSQLCVHGVVETRHPPVHREFVQEVLVMLRVVCMCWFLFLWESLKNNSKPSSLALLKLISGWRTENLCLCSCHRWQPLALHFVFTGVIISKSQVMTNSGSIYKFYSLNMKTKLEQGRIKPYPLFQKEQKKTLSLQTLVWGRNV